jgi:hypothetical protein
MLAKRRAESAPLPMKLRLVVGAAFSIGDIVELFLAGQSLRAFALLGTLCCNPGCNLKPSLWFATHSSCPIPKRVQHDVLLVAGVHFRNPNGVGIYFFVKTLTIAAVLLTALPLRDDCAWSCRRHERFCGQLGGR